MELVDVAVIDPSDMMGYIDRRQRQNPEAAAKRTFLGKQFLHYPINTNASTPPPFDPAEHIIVSSVYELDHSKLPHNSPDQLHKIRVVMVNEKTRMRVSLRFPSIYSLRSYLNETEHTNKKDMRKKLPAFDDKYMIGSEVAAEALYRRISFQEIADKSSSWSFWVLQNPSVSPRKVSDSPRRSANVNVGARKLSLISELKGFGVVKWGKRRQVRFLAKHVEDKREIVAVSNDVVKGEEEKDSDGGDDTEEEDDDDDDDVIVEVNKSREAKRKLCKRKGQGGPGSKSSPKKKRPKIEKKNRIAVNKQKKNKVIRKSIDRWSAERYKMAEVSILKVMKEQNAVFRNPILRPELRAEARKLIGDTGLLDHLLKHMAGKVAPGGEERFRRRHNADGAMEYWLEKANLVDIRKEAGVQDPYWTPPPGWKPGDNPTQDPVCAREIKELRKEIDKLKREMVSRKYEKELAIMDVPNSSPTSQDMEHGSLLLPLEEMYIDLVNKKVKMEEQLMGISRSLCGMEEEMKLLKTRVKKSNRTGSTERPALFMGSAELTTPAGSGRKGKEVIYREKGAMVLGELAQEHCQSSGGSISQTTKSAAPTEDRTAKIERLKSGFRICKPQGSFLWPDMTTSTPHPQVAAHLQDLIAVHTPPSVSSTSPKQSYLLFTPPSQTHGPRQASPMKASAERWSVIIPQSTDAKTPITCSLDRMIHNQYEKSSISTSTTINSTIKTPLINLNEPLNTNQTDDYGLFCWSHSHANAQTSPYPVTYQRRHHQNLTATIAMPSSGPTKKEMMNQWEEGDPRKGMIRNFEQPQQQMRCSSVSSIASSSMSMEVGTWLALASSKPSVEHKSKRG